MSDELIERLGQAVRLAGGPQALAGPTGTAASTMYNYLKGKPAPPMDFLWKLATAARVRPEWLLLGQLPRQDGDESGDERTMASLVQVGLVDITASAGAGSTAFDVAPTAWFAFPDDLLRGLVHDPKRARLLRVEGDSMEPEIRSGELVLVDETRTDPREGVYIVRVDDHLLVKRARRLGARRLSLQSTNPAYADLEIDLGATDVQVMGRVVWAGKIMP